MITRLTTTCRMVNCEINFSYFLDGHYIPSLKKTKGSVKLDIAEMPPQMVEKQPVQCSFLEWTIPNKELVSSSYF